MGAASGGPSIIGFTGRERLNYAVPFLSVCLLLLASLTSVIVVENRVLAVRREEAAQRSDATVHSILRASAVYVEQAAAEANGYNYPGALERLEHALDDLKLATAALPEEDRARFGGLLRQAEEAKVMLEGRDSRAPDRLSGMAIAIRDQLAD